MIVKSIVDSQRLHVKQNKHYRVLSQTRNTYVIFNELGNKVSLHKALFTKSHWLWNLFI